MSLDLVFVGNPSHSRSNLTRFLETLGVSVHFFDDLTDVKHAEFGRTAFLAAPFENAVEFRAKRVKFRAWTGRDRVIAVLNAPDFNLCAEAFRAGARDVLVSPYTSRELERLTEHLRKSAAHELHPDAILPLEAVEKQAIADAIMACNGQVSKTSRKLGIGRSTLYRKLELYGLSDVKE